MQCNDDDVGFGGRNTKVFALINRAAGWLRSARARPLLRRTSTARSSSPTSDLFYGRDAHVALILANRLIGGVNTLAAATRATPHLLLVEDKVAAGAPSKMPKHWRRTRGSRNTNGFNGFVQTAIS